MTPRFASAFRDALAQCDAARLGELWRHVFAHLPQPANHAELEIMLHRARTIAGSLTLKDRLYSHRWLEERGYPSGLPDGLRPEPIRPRIIETIGISVNARIPAMGREIHGAMVNVAGEMQADGVTDYPFIRQRMLAARAYIKRRWS